MPPVALKSDKLPEGPIPLDCSWKTAASTRSNPMKNEEGGDSASTVGDRVLRSIQFFSHRSH